MNNPKETTIKVTKKLRDYLAILKIKKEMESLEEVIWNLIEEKKR